MSAPRLLSVVAGEFFQPVVGVGKPQMFVKRTHKVVMSKFPDETFEGMAGYK